MSGMRDQSLWLHRLFLFFGDSQLSVFEEDTPRVSEGGCTSYVYHTCVRVSVFDLALQHRLREQQPSGSASSEKEE
jgi:hypothetical protein